MDLRRWTQWLTGYAAGSDAALDYARQLGPLNSQNQINRLHIDLENTLAPVEIASIARLIRRDALPDAAKAWRKSLTRLAPGLRRFPQTYTRRPLGPQLTLYRRTGAVPKGRRLLIGFCGNAERLMLPVALILQALPAQEWDVLKVTRPSGQPYLSADREVDDLDLLLSAIRQAVDLPAYATISALGTSSGARVAVLAAIRLALDRAVLMGASLAPAWLPLLPDLRRDGATLPGTGPRPSPAIVYGYGAEHAGDTRNAAEMQALFGGRLHPFAGIDNHTVLYYLLLQGWFPDQFAAFLRPDPQTAGDRALRQAWRGRGP